MSPNELHDGEMEWEWRTLRNPNLFMNRAASELQYALQPIADISTGKTYAYEALLRNVEALDCETPHEVFDKADEIGCLARLELVLRAKAIEKFLAVPDAAELKLFFNIDGRLIERDNSLLAETAALLMRHGLAPSNFCIEVTEQSNTASAEAIDHFITSARTLGFPFALDDFGQGYSQLRLLYEYSPHILKIDRFFISSIQKDAKKRLFVASLVDLAHVMGMRIVAEGVETVEELHSCREVGCDLVQGYLLAKPELDLDLLPRTYATITGNGERRAGRTSADAELVQAKFDKVATLQEDATIDDALGIFVNSGQSVIPVLNTRSEPVGIVRERDFKAFLYTPFGRDLLRNRTFVNSIKRYVGWCPTADVNARLDRLIDLTTDGLDDGLIITCGGLYCGFLSTAALLDIANEMRVRAAVDMNPLSKLPGNASINAYAATAMRDDTQDRFFCYVDIDSFKPFNDTYGFRIGDRALILLSELIKRDMAQPGAFLGHVGGDDFFIGVRGEDVDALVMRAEEFRRNFSAEAESFYEPHHRRQGFVLARDRDGNSRRFRLLTCSVSLLHMPQGVTVDDTDALSRQIAMVKQKAKQDPGGVVVRKYRPGETTAGTGISGRVDYSAAARVAVGNWPSIT
ncbi:GGDEF domain-containing protein [Tepidamorphus sp. 3E244]|uniref:GGDEF domain-containing protein n=1 Tax=Tepidamorphus sp. 3E244 TaxID=3385498 RepID=UPI0038FCD372